VITNHTPAIKTKLLMRKLLPLLMALTSLQLFAQVKPTPAAERLKGLEQRKLLEKNSTVNKVAFRNIGPSVMSGRVVDIEVNNDDPTEFYVAYATGGLWYTTNNGQSFIPVFDSADVITIGDIAVNWKTRTIWVGTGEVNSSRSSYSGIGVFKSTNNGKTWEYLGLPESHHIGKIQLHPTDNNTAWVAALGHLYSPNKERGVYKTTDGGKTWKHTLAVDENTGAVEMEINPLNPNELYAAMWYRTRTSSNLEESGKTSGLYKSVDGGETWQLLSAAGSGLPTGNVVGRMGIAVYPKEPNIVYVIVDNQASKPDTAKRDTAKYIYKDFMDINLMQFQELNESKLDTFLRDNGLSRRYTAKMVKEMVASGKLKPSVLYDYFNVNTGFEGSPVGAEVYRSDDAGKSWKKVNTKPLSLYSTYGYYFGKIYVSPVNADKVIIVGVPLQMSVDGGKTFKDIDDENVHSDHHAAWINPKRDSHILNGNDGGLNITYDNGAHWFKANMPPVGQYYGIAVDMARPYNVYGGLQDNGTWYGPSTNKETLNWHSNGDYPFKAINGGDGMQVQVDWRDNKTVYTGSQFGAYSRVTVGVRERKSIRPFRELGEEAYRFNWQTPILLSRHNQDVIYYGSNKFHRSLNRGDSMVVISSDLSTNPKQGDVPFGTLTTISESPTRFGLLYVGTDDGNIHISRDGGYSWTPITQNLPKGLYVSRVTASAFKEGRVYASLNGYRNDNFQPYLYVSEDYGATWRQIGKDLPAEPINVITEDIKYDSILYVGTDGGLYVTLNRGNNFMMWNNGLPKSVPVHDIVVHPRDNEIILGTHGRSLYIAKLEGIQRLMRPSVKGSKDDEKDKSTEPRRRNDREQEEREND
jgi:photosystem II stability/assembly factor-like uncharacterized protein